MLRQLASIVLLAAIIMALTASTLMMLQIGFPLGFSHSMGGSSIMADPLAISWNQSHLVIFFRPIDFASLSNIISQRASAFIGKVSEEVREVANINYWFRLESGVRSFYYADYLLFTRDYTRVRGILNSYMNYTLGFNIVPYSDAERVIAMLEKKHLEKISCKYEATPSSPQAQCSGKATIDVSSLSSRVSTRIVSDIGVIIVPLDSPAPPQAALLFFSSPINKTIREVLKAALSSPPSSKPIKMGFQYIVLSLSNVVRNSEFTITHSLIMSMSVKKAARIALVVLVAVGVWIAVCRYLESPCTPGVLRTIYSKSFGRILKASSKNRV